MRKRYQLGTMVALLVVGVIGLLGVLRIVKSSPGGARRESRVPASSPPAVVASPAAQGAGPRNRSGNAEYSTSGRDEDTAVSKAYTDVQWPGFLPELESVDLRGIYDGIYSAMNNVERRRLWKAQDDIRNTWPSYVEVRRALLGEALAGGPPESLSNNELLEKAAALRRQYWEEGGELSKAAYRSAYAARALLEYLHERDPTNMTVIDELVETIASTETRWTYGVASDQRVYNPEYDTILKLRRGQFDQRKLEVAQGQTPTWMDLPRTWDLVFLLCEANDSEKAKEVMDWQIREAQAGGWDEFLYPLQEFRKVAGQGTRMNLPLYSVNGAGYPEEYRFERRLPSFRGPISERREVTPRHLGAHRSWNVSWGPESSSQKR